MRCMHCGGEMPSGAAFCMYCGEKAVPSQPAEDPAIQPPQGETAAESPMEEPAIADAPAPMEDAAPVPGAETGGVPEEVGAFETDETTAGKGAETLVPKAEMDENPAELEEQPAEHLEEQEPKKRRTKLFLLGGLALLVILAAVFIPIMIRNGKQAKYLDGVSMMERGEYKGAYDAFTSLGEFEDSAEQAAIAENGIRYQDAVALMEQGSYDAALEKLNTVTPGSFPDIKDRINECKKMPIYLAAQQALAEGKKYEAYKGFTSLGSFQDAKEKAKSCLTPLPQTGESYRNSAYSGGGCELTIKAPVSGGSNVYFKIYTTDAKTLISCIFIKGGATAKVKLPAGSYIFKAAYGNENWFGPEEMFGAAGSYERLKADKSSEIFVLKKNYSYVLSLRTQQKSGTTVTSDTENRDTF